MCYFKALWGAFVNNKISIAKIAFRMLWFRLDSAKVSRDVWRCVLENFTELYFLASAFWCSTDEASCLDLSVGFVCSYVNTFMRKSSFSNQFIQSKESRRSFFTIEITKPLVIGVPGLVEIQWSIHSVLDYSPGSACRCKEEISHKPGLSI